MAVSDLALDRFTAQLLTIQLFPDPVGSSKSLSLSLTVCPTCLWQPSHQPPVLCPQFSIGHHGTDHWAVHKGLQRAWRVQSRREGGDEISVVALGLPAQALVAGNARASLLGRGHKLWPRQQQRLLQSKFGRRLTASHCEIWSFVAIFRSADLPRFASSAQRLPQPT